MRQGERLEEKFATKLKYVMKLNRGPAAYCIRGVPAGF